jgi:hypothetical protein
MTDPAIIASLIATFAVVILALANLVYRFGKLTAQVGNLRRDATRRNDEYLRQSKERYDGLISRLARLEAHLMTGSARAAGNDD